MKAVVVVELDFDPETTTGDQLNAQLREALAASDTSFPQHERTAHAAVGDDAEMVLDVFRPAEPGAGLHVAILENGRWHLEHSLRCRRAGLDRCPVTVLVAHTFEAGHFEMEQNGRYRVWIDDAGVLLWEEV